MTNLKKENYIPVDSVSHLKNGEQGLVFFIEMDQEEKHPDLNKTSLVPAFAVRFKDEIQVFKNICGHIAINLDFQPGQFFDDIGEHLICSTHGALYQADTGKCLGGPCFGVGLEKIKAEELDGFLFIIDSSVVSVKLGD